MISSITGAGNRSVNPRVLMVFFGMKVAYLILNQGARKKLENLFALCNVSNIIKSENKNNAVNDEKCQNRKRKTNLLPNNY